MKTILNIIQLQFRRMKKLDLTEKLFINAKIHHHGKINTRVSTTTNIKTKSFSNIYMPKHQ